MWLEDRLGCTHQLQKDIENIETNINELQSEIKETERKIEKLQKQILQSDAQRQPLTSIHESDKDLIEEELTPQDSKSNSDSKKSLSKPIVEQIEELEDELMVMAEKLKEPLLVQTRL